MGKLDGRVAVVTGGSRGIGEAIAAAFAREGANVAIASRKIEALQRAADRINAQHGERVIPMPCHVGKPEQVRTLFERVRSELGPADVLVNNAGTNPYFGPMLGCDWPAWDKTFEVNLKGPFEMTRAFVQALHEAGRGGAVVNIASIVGSRAAPMQGVYGMTKAALSSMTKTLAVELARAGVRVNAIAPGLVDTRLAAAIVDNPELRAMVLDRAPIDRPARPEEIAGMAVYLASDDASYVTGQTFHVDGGYTIA